jgi:hypothetical protein
MESKNFIIFLIIILLLIFCVYNFGYKNLLIKDNFQDTLVVKNTNNKSKTHNNIIQQIKHGLANVIGFHHNRIKNVSYIGDISEQVISIHLELIPHNNNLPNILTNSEIINIINQRIEDDILYLNINNIEIKITNQNLTKQENDSFQNTNDKVNPNKISEYVEKTGREISRGLPFNHNLERYYEIDHIKQTLINPPELMIEEENA